MQNTNRHKPKEVTGKRAREPVPNKGVTQGGWHCRTNSMAVGVKSPRVRDEEEERGLCLDSSFWEGVVDTGTLPVGVREWSRDTSSWTQ